MFVNVSNHSSDKWSPEQLKSARQFGEVVDLGFPNVNPNLFSVELEDLVLEWLEKITSLEKDEMIHVHLMGETGFVCRLAMRLSNLKFHVLHSTTARVVEEKADGTKVSIFKFVRFRDTF
jgi:hypothetical protein